MPADVPFIPVSDARPDDIAWPPLRWPPGGPLVGEYVGLHSLDPERDAAAVFAALDHDPVWRHVAGRPVDADATAEVYRASLAAGRHPWLVRLCQPLAGLPAGAVVGSSSYCDVGVVEARLEIGFTAYTPGVWGSAVNPETKLLLLAHAFDDLGAGRVQLKTDVRNVRSQRAIAALGACYEGTLRRYQRRTDNTMRDTALFSIVAEEWPAVRDRIARRVIGE